MVGDKQWWFLAASVHASLHNVVGLGCIYGHSGRYQVHIISVGNFELNATHILLGSNI